MSHTPPEKALRFLVKHEPPFSNGHVSWALTGGLACQLYMRMYNGKNWHRSTKDLDLYAFKSDFGSVPLSSWEVITISDGHLKALPAFGPFRTPDICLDVWRNFHYDNIVPASKDVCEASWDGLCIPVLRPEFLFVFKTLCCFFRRPKDEFDAAGLLEVAPFRQKYFSDVIARSPFASFLPAHTRPEHLCNTAFRQELAARLSAAKLHDAQEELFSTLPPDMLFPLIQTEQRKNILLDVALLQSCIRKQRINQLSEAEQALALLLACWSVKSPTPRLLMETQELLYQATFLQGSCFDVHTYFAYATRWGRYMQPLMHTDYAGKLRTGFLQSNMRSALMTQAGILHAPLA